MTATLRVHELYEELGLPRESGRRFVRMAELEGLLSRKVRIGGSGGSSSPVRLRVSVERLTPLAESHRRPKAAAVPIRPRKDRRCKATCERAHRPLWDHRCVGPAGHLGQHQFTQPCEDDEPGVHRPRDPPCAPPQSRQWGGIPSSLVTEQYDTACPLCGKRLRGLSRARDRTRRAVRQHVSCCHPEAGDRERSLLADMAAGGAPW